MTAPIFKTLLFDTQGALGVSDSKESTCNAEDLGSVPGLGRSPGEGNGNIPLYLVSLYCIIVSCLENPTGQRSLVDYRPWSHRESDTTKQLTLDKTIGCSVMGLLVKVGVG